MTDTDVLLCILLFILAFIAGMSPGAVVGMMRWPHDTLRRPVVFRNSLLTLVLFGLPCVLIFLHLRKAGASFPATAIVSIAGLFGASVGFAGSWNRW